MRWLLCGMMVMLASAGVGYAQEELNSEQWKKMYDDALVQLKAVQDRRNELAMENERLLTRVAQMQKQMEDAKRQLKAVAEKTFNLRSQNAAYKDFLDHYPAMRARWNAFLDGSILSVPSDLLEFLDTDWPLPAAG